MWICIYARHWLLLALPLWLASGIVRWVNRFLIVQRNHNPLLKLSRAFGEFAFQLFDLILWLLGFSCSKWLRCDVNFSWVLSLLLLLLQNGPELICFFVCLNNHLVVATYARPSKQAVFKLVLNDRRWWFLHMVTLPVILDRLEIVNWLLRDIHGLIFGSWMAR